MISVLFLGLVFLDLVLQPLLPRLVEHLVVAAVRVQPHGVQVQDVGGHSVEELSVVRHHQDGLGPILKGGTIILIIKDHPDEIPL